MAYQELQIMDLHLDNSSELIFYKQPKYVESTQSLKKTFSLPQSLSYENAKSPKRISKKYISKNSIYYYKKVSDAIQKSRSNSPTKVESTIHELPESTNKIADNLIEDSDQDTAQHLQYAKIVENVIKKQKQKIFTDAEMKNIFKQLDFQFSKITEYSQVLLDRYEYQTVDYNQLLLEVTRDKYKASNVKQYIKAYTNETIQNIQKLIQLREEQLQLEWQLGPFYDKTIKFERMNYDFYLQMGSLEQLKQLHNYIFMRRKELIILLFQYPLSIKETCKHYILSSEFYIDHLIEKAEHDQDSLEEGEMQKIEDQILLEKRFQEEIPNMLDKQSIKELAKEIAQSRFYYEATITNK
ncbi:Hypothetical_protein [Hexamita inflata]|uniref:Hypothetical_protein n=1 Tax=Hexamita inflata TaxID=28002 RepID=A0AA86U8Z6_9EUKA|nr:Hypothetical protein HINF_LOCUS16351 [Hexamita inflata]CAI9933868.1 Hypothetical protein HINF_LOCUS21513 [Hexamita inflata]